jgi:hypothetical protein
MAGQSVGREVFLVALGAFLGVIPVVTNNILEQKNEAKERAVEQRLTVLRDYAGACDRSAAAATRLLVWLELGAEAAGGKDSLQLIETELTAASIDHATQTHLVAAFFGDAAKLASDTSLEWVELNQQALDKELQQLKQRAPKALRNCDADVRMLAGLLQR